MGIRMSDVSVRPGGRPPGGTRTAGSTKAYIAPPLAPPRPRPLTPPRERPAPPPRQRPMVQPQPGRPAPPRGRPTASPRGVRGDGQPPRALAATGGDRSPRGTRLPFIVLLCGLLTGALASLLVISTTLATGAYRITSLQSQVNSLTLQRQQLQEQVASDNSAQVIADRAEALGMRWQGMLRFIDLKTSKVKTDAGTGADSEIDVPGYTP